LEGPRIDVSSVRGPFFLCPRNRHGYACYKPPHHPSFSIGAVDAGSSLFSGAAEGLVTLRPGTLVFIPAARVHACNPAPGTAWSYQMLGWLQRMRQEYAQAAPHAGRQNAPLAPEPVQIVTDPALYAQFYQLNALLFSNADHEPLPVDPRLAGTSK
jgi:hypothetical protein